MVSLLGWKVSLWSTIVQRYLYDLPPSISWLWNDSLGMMAGLLWKSTTFSLVFEELRARQSCLHHSSEMSITDCSCIGVFLIHDYSVIRICNVCYAWVGASTVITVQSVQNRWDYKVLWGPCGNRMSRGNHWLSVACQSGKRGSRGSGAGWHPSEVAYI